MLADGKFFLPIPASMPLLPVIAGGFLLFAAQLAVGTSLLFAELVFLFVFLTGVGIRMAGGLARLGGICIAAMSLKLVIISQIAKTILGEPGDLRLEVPHITMGVLTAGLASVVCGAALARPFQVREPWFATDNRPEALKHAAILTFLVGSISHLGVMATGVDGNVLQVGGLPGLLRQLAFAISLSVVFSTAHVIQRSGGARLLSWFNLLPAGFFFSLGVLASSKQGMLEPIFLIALTGIAFRYRFSLSHLVFGCLFLAFTLLVIFPFGQVARNHTRGSSVRESFELSVEFIGRHFGSVEGYLELLRTRDDAESETSVAPYYERPIGFLDRLSLIKMADLLVAATERDGISRWETITHGFEMALPRFIYPSKPAINTGTYLGKKAGVISDEDWGTQISFGFIADAFSSFSWLGASIIPGVATFLFLLLFNTLTGPLEKNVWCIFFVAQFQHFFAEQTLSAMTLTLVRMPIWYIALHLALHWSWKLAEHHRATFSLGALARPQNA